MPDAGTCVHAYVETCMLCDMHVMNITYLLCVCAVYDVYIYSSRMTCNLYSMNDTVHMANMMHIYSTRYQCRISEQQPFKYDGVHDLAWALLAASRVGNFTSPMFECFLRGFCVDSSSPQISAITVGSFH